VSRCDFLPRAEADLEAIADYIAQDSPAPALAFVRRIRERCRALADFPYRGEARHGLQEGIRSRLVGNYVIFYRPVAGDIEVVRVLHGRQDVEAEFEQ
jgi:toxin ParE1/3/4